MASVLPADSHPAPPGVDLDLRVVSRLLHEEFDDDVDPCEVDECLSRVGARFDCATVRSFVPLLVRRYAREELQQRLRRPLVEPQVELPRQWPDGGDVSGRHLESVPSTPVDP